MSQSLQSTLSVANSSGLLIQFFLFQNGFLPATGYKTSTLSSLILIFIIESVISLRRFIPLIVIFQSLTDAALLLNNTDYRRQILVPLSLLSEILLQRYLIMFRKGFLDPLHNTIE